MSEFNAKSSSNFKVKVINKQRTDSRYEIVEDENQEIENNGEYSDQHTENSLKKFQSRLHTISNIIHLKTSPATILYAIYRSDILHHLSWSEYIRHFLPYPILIISIWLLQIGSFVLMEVEHAKIGEHGNNYVVLFARIIALLMLGFHTLGTGNAQRDAIKCILYDAFFTKQKYVIFLFFPLFQAIVEIVALRISADVILEAGTVVEVFKDAMSLIVILELDNWISDALSKRDLGLEEDAFIIAMANQSLKDKKKSKQHHDGAFMLYFVISCSKIAVLIWDIYHEVYDTLYVADDQMHY